MGDEAREKTRSAVKRARQSSMDRKLDETIGLHRILRGGGSGLEPPLDTREKTR
jgi:hypothetical protein